MTAMLDVAVTLCGIYVALAVLCSWIQEQIATLLELRAKNLESGVKQLISCDATTFAAIAKHPLVASAVKSSKRDLSSYLASRNFSLAFWQTIGTAASTDVKAVMVSATTVATLARDVNAWAPTGASNDVRTSAVALLTTAEGDYDKLLAATDVWFDAQMDRVSGWYKRQAQYILVVIALSIAYVFSINSIDIGRQLYAAPLEASAAANLVSSAVSSGGTATDVAKKVASAEELQDLKLFHGSSAKDVAPAERDSFWLWLGGCLITAIAAALGAPFWFDVLQRLCNVRMAGAKPTSSG